MLGWAITFLIVALVAAILGFGGIAVLPSISREIIFCRGDHSVRHLRGRGA